MSKRLSARRDWFVREHNVRSSSKAALVRMAFAAVFGSLLAVAFAVCPIGSSAQAPVVPSLAWAAGAEAAPDDAAGDGADGGQAGSAAAAGQGGSAAAGDEGSGSSTQQVSSTASGASSSASAQSSASSASGSASSSSDGEPVADRGYVGPWYALNHNYVVAVEDRFDAITDEEYATTLTRTVLMAVAAVAAVLAIAAFVRAYRIQARAAKKRR